MYLRRRTDTVHWNQYDNASPRDENLKWQEIFSWPPRAHILELQKFSCRDDGICLVIAFSQRLEKAEGLQPSVFYSALGIEGGIPFAGALAPVVSVHQPCGMA